MLLEQNSADATRLRGAVESSAEHVTSRAHDGYIKHEGCDHIFFIGFLGAGKSTVARNLGMLFGRHYVDTDRMAERICHKSVADVYADSGEEAFRTAETTALRRLASQKSLLVSCGGGIVEREENCSLMRDMGVIVFLDGALEDSLRQIRCMDSRPELMDLSVAEQLYKRRHPMYEAISDLRIDICDKSFEEVADAAGKLLWEEGLL